MERHKFLIITIVLSVVLTVTFLIINYANPYILQIDAQWLIIAGIPILVGLVAGGYIKSFKGLGIEIESALKESVNKIDLIKRINFEEAPPQTEKEGVQKLRQMKPGLKSKLKRLRLIENKKKLLCTVGY